LEQLPRVPDGLLFHGPRSGRLKPDVVRRTLIDSVLEPLSSEFPTPDGEVGFKDGRLHSFRHYFVSTCILNGVPERTIMRWLGHSDSKMVDHYCHLFDDESRR
jgi:integrase